MPTDGGGKGTVRCEGWAIPTKMIDDIIEPSSSARAYAEFSTPLFPVVLNTAVDLIAMTLMRADWEMFGDTKAYTTLSAGLGWGNVSFQRTYCIMGGKAFLYYDPSFEDAPSGFYNGDPTILIVAVPIGRTNSESRDHLIGAINAAFFGVLTASADETTEAIIHIVSDLPGTTMNGFVVGGQPSGSISVGGIMAGGGWVLRSHSEYETVRFGNQADIKLYVFTGSDASVGGLTLVFEIEGHKVAFSSANTRYRMIAGTFQVVFLGTGSAGGFDPYSGNNFAWGCTPFTEMNKDVSDAAFVVFNNAAGGSNSIGVPSAFTTAHQWLNGGYENGTSGAVGWGFATLHYEVGGGGSSKILDINNKPILQQAPVFLSIPFIGEARIAGIVPDAFISSEYTAPPRQIYYQSQPTAVTPTDTFYRCIGAQHYVENSIFVASGETTPAFDSVDSDILAWGVGNAFTLDATTGVLDVTKLFASHVPLFEDNLKGHVIMIGGTKHYIVGVSFGGDGNMIITFVPPVENDLIGVTWAIMSSFT